MLGLAKEKLRESLSSVLPIALIVAALSLTVAPLSPANMLLFIIGVVFLIAGMSVFTLGAEMSMQQIGAKVGTKMASSGKIWLMAFVSFIIGILVTVSEPDLVILSEQVKSVKPLILILTVSLGVGIFLMIAVLRIIFKINLSIILVVFYISAFVLSFFLPEGFRTLAFDSGGVTTGPMTVPFIMSIGAGVSASMSSSKDGRDESFGITGLCSIGPIISVMVLGIVAGIGENEYHPEAITEISTTQEAIPVFLSGIVKYIPEVFAALLPIIVFTAFFQLFTRAYNKKQLIRVGIGFAYTLIGLAVFLTGANVGFMPTGSEIGVQLAKIWHGIPLIPVSMLLGYFIVKAEPSVYVLNKLVEEMSAGAISGKVTGRGLSIGVCAALGLAALRIVADIPILYILIPGYLIALVLSFFVPKIFVGISFDSGGVASGTMMSAFVLPLCIGACNALGGDIMEDAFGCVALVAMAPIISIEICGLIYRIKSEHRVRSFISAKETFVDYGYSAKRVSHKTEQGGDQK